jgi:ketosteroid isomerase-like protein
MRILIVKFLSILIFLQFLSVTISASNEDDLRNIIEPLNKKFVNSILEEDLAEYLSLYTDDAVVMIPFQPTLNGKNALTVHWHNNMAKGEWVESVNVTTLDIWASGDLIYERGSYQITFKKFENKPRAVYGSYFSVWKKQPDGTYKMKYDISNLNHGV